MTEIVKEMLDITAQMIKNISCFSVMQTPISLHLKLCEKDSA